MNFFIVGFDPPGVELEPARRSLEALAGELGFLDASAVRSWRSADGKATASWLAHDGVAVGGTEYAYADDERFALFAGRPIRWMADGKADGRGTLDPRAYLAPPTEWAEGLDGRFVAVRYDNLEHRLEVVTDPLGSYPVYASKAGTTRWVSNRPALLVSLQPRQGFDIAAITHFLASGWALGGGCLWEGVRRLERGHVHRFGHHDSKELLVGVDERSLVGMFGKGLDPDEAARVLVESLRAAADWPGRPNVVPLSGGLDSRLVFAAAVVSGADFKSRTIAFPEDLGYPETGDAMIGRRIAADHSVPHTIVTHDSDDGVRADARMLRLLTHGLVSIGDTGPLRIPPPGMPLELLFSGQGGEISRTDYGIGKASAPELLAQILQHVVPRWPKPLVNVEGEELVRSYVRGWIDHQLEVGARPNDLTDLFYLLERMPNWAGPAQMYYETIHDVISPLWLGRLIPHEFALDANDRARDLFHFELLSLLLPDLARLDFDGTNPPWPTFGKQRSGRAQNARVLVDKVMREARRRVRARLHRSADLQSDRLFVESMNEARRGVAANEDHPAWHYLDSARVKRLLDTDPLRLDPRSRRAVTRLASVFVVDD